MLKSQIPNLPPYFDRYINLVPDQSLIDVLKQFGLELFQSEMSNFEKLGSKVYEEGKWTIQDIIQHIIDTERIFSYRALRIARRDKTPLPGFDENNYASSAQANDRKLKDLINEFASVRNSTINLFQSFNNEDLIEESLSSTITMSPLAIGFTITGHVLHHLNVIKERYYPLINK